MMKLFILFFICLFQIQSFAFFKGVFPNEVESQCEFQWVKNSWKGGKDFAIAKVNVLIELKSAAGVVEDRSYIFLECRGDSPKIKERPYYDFANTTTSCMGLRINGLDKSKLDTSTIDAIRAENVEVKPTQGSDKLVLVWQESSTFEIEDGKSFSWSMKSKLSGNTFKGFVACKK